MIEEWRPIAGHEGSYEVSSFGRVRSLPRIILWGEKKERRRVPGRVLKPVTGVNFYPAVSLPSVSRELGGRAAPTKIHWRVAEAFIGPRDPGAYVCHFDGDPTNNRADNLRYGTPADNIQDTLRHGRHGMARKTHCKRGHLLAGANLYPSDLLIGSRRCVACTRAKAYCRQHGSPDQVQRISDEAFARITEVAA